MAWRVQEMPEPLLRVDGPRDHQCPPQRVQPPSEASCLAAYTTVVSQSKNSVRIGENAIGAQDAEGVRLFMQFRDFLGDYPIHCHNTVHEDHAMMALWQIVP
jgi:hypothetical protein